MIFNPFKLVKYWLTYSNLANSRFFDAKFYLFTYPDVRQKDFDPINHYIMHGAMEGRNPSAHFDTSYYLAMNPDVSLDKINPLLHYVKYGVKEGRQPKAHKVDNVQNIASRGVNKESSSYKLLRKEKNRNRIAVLSITQYSGYLNPQLEQYVEELTNVAKVVVVVVNGELSDADSRSLSGRVDGIVVSKPVGHVYASFYTGFTWLERNNFLENGDWLIFCNDNMFGPIFSFIQMFDQMESAEYDFWGITQLRNPKTHVQPDFLVFRPKVFLSSIFKEMLVGSESVKGGIENQIEYNCMITTMLEKNDFVLGVYMEETLFESRLKDFGYNEVNRHPILLLENGVPLLTKESLVRASNTVDGTNRVLRWLKNNNASAYQSAIGIFDVRKFEAADDVGFTIIMPTKNRRSIIGKAIDSVLRQTHDNYELVIVDDGSTDGTEEYIQAEYIEEIESGRINYVKLSYGVGVCNARNIGISYSKNSWLCYLDSDNLMRDYFLTVFANAIIEDQRTDLFYASAVKNNSNSLIGRAFSGDTLKLGNYIDLGTLVHRKSLVDQFGGFDPDLKRLVDWDLILKYTKHKKPVFIDNVCVMEYEDRIDDSRISVKESYLKAKIAVSRKHSGVPTISTVILSYNHEKYVEEAIESAIQQEGCFIHEILLSDDGSSDKTRKIVKGYAKKYPKLIRDISSNSNCGITRNYQHCFKEAQGDYISILEGDDYWTDTHKNEHQKNFLKDTHGVPMVFSKIDLLNEETGIIRQLKRQENLPTKIGVAEFVANKYLNLIVNLSSVMVKSEFISNMPSFLYEPRFSEITLAFYADRCGGIGFLDTVMSVYRQNDSSVWSGASKASQYKQAVEIRKSALCLARNEYKHQVKMNLDKYQGQLDMINNYAHK